MPARGSADPGGLPARIEDWLRDNPGEHRAGDVARGVTAPAGRTPAQWVRLVGGALSRMTADDGRGKSPTVKRENRDLGLKNLVGFYSYDHDAAARERRNPERGSAGAATEPA